MKYFYLTNLKVEISFLLLLSKCVCAKINSLEKENLEKKFKVLRDDFNAVLENAEDLTRDFFGEIVEASQNVVNRAYPDYLEWDSSEDKNTITKSKHEVTGTTKRINLKALNNPLIARKKRSVQPEVINPTGPNHPSSNEQLQEMFINPNYLNRMSQQNIVDPASIVKNQFTQNNFRDNLGEETLNQNGPYRLNEPTFRNNELPENCDAKSQREYELEKRKLNDLKTEVKKLNDILLLIKDQHQIINRFNQSELNIVEHPLNNKNQDIISELNNEKKINVYTTETQIPTHKEIEIIRDELSRAVKSINQTTKILALERIKANNLEKALKGQKDEINFLKIMMTNLFKKADTKNSLVDFSKNQSRSSDEMEADKEQILGSTIHFPKSLPENQNQKETLVSARDSEHKDVKSKTRESNFDSSEITQLLKLLAQSKKESGIKETKSDDDDFNLKLEELKKQMKAKREEEQLIEEIKNLKNFKSQSNSEISTGDLQKLIISLGKQQSKSDDVETELKQLQFAINNLRPKDENSNFGIGGKDEAQDFQTTLNQLINENSGNTVSNMAGNIHSASNIPSYFPTNSQYQGYQGRFPSTIPYYANPYYKMSPYSSNYNNAFNPNIGGLDSLSQTDYTGLNNQNDIYSGILNSGPISTKAYGSTQPSAYFGSSSNINHVNPYSYSANMLNNYDKINYNQPGYQAPSAGQNSYSGLNQNPVPGIPNIYSSIQSSYITSPMSKGQSSYPSSGYSSNENSLFSQDNMPSYTKQFFPQLPNKASVSESTALPVDYGHKGTSTASNDQSQYSATNTENRYQMVVDLTNQIDGLENVIKSLSIGDYGQKGEDKQTIITLEQRINDLKNIIRSLNQPEQYTDISTASKTVSPPVPSIGVYGQPVGRTYNPPINSQLPQGNPPQVSYNGPAAPISAPSPAPMQALNPGPQNLPYKNRKRRQVTPQSDLFGRYNQNVNTDYLKNPNPGSDALSQISALFQKFLEENITRTPKHAEQNHLEGLQEKLDDLKKELERKSQLRAYNEYPNYDGIKQPYDYNQIPISYQPYKIKTAFKDKSRSVDGSKPDILTSIVIKIIDHIANSLPDIIQHLFGKFFSKISYGQGYSYGPLQNVFKNLGIFGIIPMVIFKIIDGFSYIFSALKKKIFFVKFLLPGIIFLLVGGSIFFLFWFLETDSNENTYNSIPYNLYNPNSNLNYNSVPNGYYNQRSSNIEQGVPKFKSASTDTSQNFQRNNPTHNLIPHNPYNQNPNFVSNGYQMLADINQGTMPKYESLSKDLSQIYQNENQFKSSDPNQPQGSWPRPISNVNQNSNYYDYSTY